MTTTYTWGENYGGWAEDYDAWSGSLTPMLARLFDSKVFSAGMTVSGKIEFVEECDRYYNDGLTPDEIRQLAAELILLADRYEQSARAKAG